MVPGGDVTAQQLHERSRSSTSAGSTSSKDKRGAFHSTAGRSNASGQHGPSTSLPSSPAPRLRHSTRAWQVAVTAEGLLAGCPPPPACHDMQRLLACVLEDSHELSEPEILLLFGARGSDFQVL